jgi:RNA polymerase sigma factor (sigma-70 family)
MYESDQDLIDACRRGDSHAWDWLLNKYERLVFSIPLNYGLSREDAADVAQISFTILLQSLETLVENTHLAPWLTTVARRHTWRLLAHYQREHTIPPSELGERLGHLVDESSRHVEARWELLEWLDQGLAQLGENCRALLLALYFNLQQPSYADVAGQLNMPVGSIGPTRARCLRRLQRILHEQRDRK